MYNESDMKNNYAFIDSQNLNLGIKSQGWQLDFRKFRQYLRSKYKVTKAYLFIGHVADNEKLYDHLKKCGYIIIFRPTLEHKEGSEMVVKGNVDSELVLHAMIQYNKYDKALIVSGDGDFHCLIEYLDEKEKLLKVLVPTSRYSSLIRKFNEKGYIARIDLIKRSVAKKRTGIRVRSKP
jgi:uncharacterized LabA/DUF88 family protein